MNLIDILVKDLPRRGGWTENATEFYLRYGSKFAQFFRVDGIADGSELIVTDGVECSDGLFGERIINSEYESALASLWQNAPAWATHVIEQRDGGRRAFAENFDYMSRAIYAMDVELYPDNEVRIANPTQWIVIADREVVKVDIDELIPIGTIVDIIGDEGRLKYGFGESGEIIAHVENTNVVRMSYGLGCFYSDRLRTIRSEADKKRDSASSKIFDAICASLNDDSESTSYAIYDAIASGKIPGIKLDDK